MKLTYTYDWRSIRCREGSSITTDDQLRNTFRSFNSIPDLTVLFPLFDIATHVVTRHWQFDINHGISYNSSFHGGALPHVIWSLLLSIFYSTTSTLTGSEEPYHSTTLHIYVPLFCIPSEDSLRTKLHINKPKVVVITKFLCEKGIMPLTETEIESSLAFYTSRSYGRLIHKP